MAMSDSSKIEWCDATWNPVVGCSPVDPGCAHCYAVGAEGELDADLAHAAEELRKAGFQ